MWTRMQILSSPWQKLRNCLPSGKTLTLAVGGLLLSGAAFFLGRQVGLPGVAAQQPPFMPVNGQPGQPQSTDEYSKRVVAYIYDAIPITRAELGEYLIARFGGPRIDFLVNRRIVEVECQKNHISITSAEVDAQYFSDLREMKLSDKDFKDQILKRFNKTLFEWKEDVIRPKLEITRLVQPMVTVSQGDVSQAFDAKYGRQMRCRMIAYDDFAKANRGWELISKSANVRETYLDEAGKQFNHQLAALKGEIPPIHLHFPDQKIEKEAFRLKADQISGIIDLGPKTYVVLLCEAEIPRNETKRFEEERTLLEREVYEKKLAERIPTYMNELRERRAPRYFLPERQVVRQEEVVRQIEKEIHPAQKGISGN